jgi:hypothetical protein
MALDCAKFNDFLFRRSPQWFPKMMARDRFPQAAGYLNMWPQEKFPNFLGTELHWNKIHVTRPNDNGAWEQMDSAPCAMNICDPPRKYVGWGETDLTFTKYHQDYVTPPFCFDQLRHVTDAEMQLAAIVDGLAPMSKGIMSDFLRLLAIQQSNVIHIAGSANATVTVTPSMFINGSTRLDLGASGNLPTSELTMNYLNNHVEDLEFNGYFDKKFMLPDMPFMITSDKTTWQRLSNANPELKPMYVSADFKKGGQFYEFGIMKNVGNWAMKVDDEPFRYQHIGNGVLERIWPFENQDTTIGKEPVFSEAYKNARYQLYHVFNRAARTVYVGDVAPVGSGMTFNLARDMMGRWKWIDPGRGLFQARDPNNGTVCTYSNDKGNKGYWLAEFEAGMRTIHPKIEMWIIALREPTPIFNEVPCATEPAQVYQTTIPYNPWCGDED